MKKCFLELSSPTRAYKAREALAKNGISSVVLKKTGNNGCIHGIEYDCTLKEKVDKIVEML